MKQFSIPYRYRSHLISAIKENRKKEDKLKKDFSPTLLNFGPVQIYLARHFGLCYGVENAIEIAFRTIEENPDKRIFLLSEMIHNPKVNDDLQERGVRFLQDTEGNQLIPFEDIHPDDIVIIPAFGTTLNIENKLIQRGVTLEKYNTTCPFVEKVWNRSAQIAQKKYTVIIHGKPSHEETRATFSHAAANTPSVIVKDMKDAELLAKYIKHELPSTQFYIDFAGKYSDQFDVTQHLQRVGVVNQTTMLASDTQAIADFIKKVMIATYAGENNPEDRFADTRDTLCYATNDNQSAVYGLLQTEADLAVVVGGYKSSNTSHLVELCEHKLPTFYIESADKIMSSSEILHYNFHEKKEYTSGNFLPSKTPLKILMTSGASCPDATVEAVIEKIISFFPVTTTLSEMTARFS